jgi:hypothetical protein
MTITTLDRWGAFQARIAELTRERDALREALKLISNYYDTADKLRELARAALEAKP